METSTVVVNLYEVKQTIILDLSVCVVGPRRSSAPTNEQQEISRTRAKKSCG